jgi:hypothetical protein
VSDPASRPRRRPRSRPAGSLTPRCRCRVVLELYVASRAQNAANQSCSVARTITERVQVLPDAIGRQVDRFSAVSPAAGSGCRSAGTAFSTSKNRRQDSGISPSVQHSDDPQRSLVRSVGDHKVVYYVKTKRSAVRSGRVWPMCGKDASVSSASNTSAMTLSARQCCRAPRCTPTAHQDRRTLPDGMRSGSCHAGSPPIRAHDCVAEPEMLEPGSAATTRSCPDTVPCSMLGR